MVIAAETGSGKTHSYLVPLIDRLCTWHSELDHISANQGPTSTPSLLLVLCPNVLLCEQVVCMAKALTGDNGEPLVSIAAVCGRQVLLVQWLHTCYCNPFPQFGSCQRLRMSVSISSIWFIGAILRRKKAYCRDGQLRGKTLLCPRQLHC